MAPKTDRRTQHSEESRRRILQAAAEISAERGYDGTSVALVTKRSGLPASSVYWHFGSKDELLAEVVEHSYRQWLPRKARWAPPEPGTDRVAYLRDALRQAGASFADQPEFMRLGLMLLLERRAEEPAARVRFKRIRAEMLDAMSEWWEAMLPEEVNASHPHLPRMLAQLNMAAADGLYMMSVGDPEEIDMNGLQELLALALDAVADRIARQVYGEE
ncbi:DNA-binding transcriptional regulator, AcrR family [Thermomonospora echinospora]|uniref:DNA-binding transcriptional regulator, AcrR family n=1 Tax=Thermomonospora echinospora TaxID=1992 RepID=A0A1H6C0X4_9ACTN|nr:TetR/AcrR family transcriptional regulator [Thermomonospora echinospora]SEG66036.1 DNA-binding transcriptional regulator, AcrR family [Thermomonospora echinospora]